jgi:putative transposase
VKKKLFIFVPFECSGGVEQVEFVTAEWVDWFNQHRLYQYCGDIPPIEMETAYYAQHRARPTG